MTSRIVPNLRSDTPDAGASFFEEVLGLERVMTLDFITTYAAPGNPSAQISLLNDPSGLHPVYSVGVPDVDVCHDRAIEQGHEILYPLTDEPWGVRRFFVRDPSGAIANIVAHRH